MEPQDQLQPVYLPEDIVREILEKVPVTTLVKFSCVCKLWRDVVIKVKNPHFGDRHLENLNKYFNDHQAVVFFRQFHSNPSNIEDSLITRNVMPLLPPDHDPCLKIIGSCNGIVCLAQYGGTTHIIHLYNPITREDLELPPSTEYDGDYKYSIEYYEQRLGFGFDASCNDYKVIWIGRRVRIYKLSTRSWNELDVNQLQYSEKWHFCRGGLFMNGFFHWPVFMRNAINLHDMNEMILTFNFKTETFGEIYYPQQDRCYRDQNLAELNDSLAILCLKRNGTKVEVWVMREHGKNESWTKRYSVDFAIPIRRVLSFWVRRDMSLEVLGILDCLNKGKVVAFLTERGECSTLFPFELGFSCSWLLFRPSLVSLLQRGLEADEREEQAR